MHNPVGCSEVLHMAARHAFDGWQGLEESPEGIKEVTYMKRYLRWPLTRDQGWGSIIAAATSKTVVETSGLSTPTLTKLS